MTWTVALLPLLTGLALWAGRLLVPAWRGDDGAPPASLAWLAGATALGTAAVAALAAARSPSATYDVGAGIRLVADLDAYAAAFAITVPLVAAAVTVFAAHHEDPVGRHRLVSLLLVFVGAMELVVIAGDLVTLLVGWELLAALSWGLIGHDWRDPDAPRSAAHAFNATRSGALGLFVAAGVAWAETGSFAYADLGSVTGGALDVFVVGIGLAAISKSAQVPFAPWLFSAMAGPSSVSALLHSSTMVAAGVYLLVRLHTVLDHAAWFAPTAIGIGLVTALSGGVVALLQQHAKRLLAASTSAQYGLMLVAVGAGYPIVAVVHFVVHAAFKAQLFLGAGVASHAVGSPQLARMRLGHELPTTAALTAVGALSLAALPPLAGGFSKEQVVAAAGHEAVWLALLATVAGGLGAAYAARFHLLAFGRGRRGPRDLAAHPGPTERVVIATFTLALLGLSAVWVPAVHDAVTGWFGALLPPTEPWELALSTVTVLGAGYATHLADRHGRLGSVGATARSRIAADWLGLPTLARRVIVDPCLRLATAIARFDDQVLDRGVESTGRAGLGLAHRLGAGDRAVVDAGVRAVARLGTAVASWTGRVSERGLDGAVEFLARTVDRAGRDARRSQTGLVHHQYLVIGVGIVAVVLAALLGR